MKKLILLSVLALVFCGFTTDTFAQKRDKGYYGNRGSYNDRDRIRRGVRTGRITRDEARELRNRERELSRERRQYRRDGVITREERREIRRDERQQDRRIRREARDDDRSNRRYNNRGYQRRGNGYYRRGAGSPYHPRFGRRY